MATRILSIDGGGIRGVMAAYWLKELEAKLGKSLYESFDLFAGTSTGAIIAAALASGTMSADQLLELYRTRGREIFAPRPIHRIVPPMMRGLMGPTYNGKGLEKVLGEEFGDTKLSDVSDQKKRLLIVAFDVHGRKPKVFDSDNSADADHTLAELCKASAAAPTYFPAHLLTHKASELPGSKGTWSLPLPFLDGGLAANNPSAVALGRARQASEDGQILLVSIGTGRVQEPINARKIRRQVLRRGKVAWAKSVIEYLFDGSSEANHEVVANSLLDNYFRFQTKLGKDFALDRASTADIDNLVAIASREWGRREKEDMVSELKDALEAGSSARLDSYAGVWESTFRWAPTISPKEIEKLKELKLDESSKDQVMVRQLGNMISGGTFGEVEFPYTFHGKIVDRDDLIGEWKSKTAEIEGTFQLRRDIEQPDVVRGVWSGTGSTGLYAGTWALTRQAKRHTPSREGPDYSIVRSFSRDVERPLEALDHLSLEVLSQLQHEEHRYPLLLARCEASVKGLPTILISGGVHGNEPAGVYAAIAFLRRVLPRYRDHFNFIVFPCVNPSGFEADTLETRSQANLNRSFGSQEAPAEVGTIQEWLTSEKPRLRMSFDLHETVFNYRGEGFDESHNPRACYLYETRPDQDGRIGRALIDSLDESIEVCQRPTIYEDVNDAGVIAYPGACRNPVYEEASTFDGYLFENGYTTHSFTTETPTGWKLEKRIQVQLKWLETALDILVAGEKLDRPTGLPED